MKYGCIGERLSHSFSKEIHNALMKEEYRLCELKKSELESFMKKRDFAGINVTIPYKEAVIPFLDEITPEAARVRAVNTIRNTDGKLCGTNTDMAGMRALIEKNRISFRAKKVLILGSGGTSKTALCVAQDLGAREIIRVSRSQKENTVSYETAKEKHFDADILINTTPCGMFPNLFEKPVDLKDFSKLSAVIDVIYNPLSTRLVSQARQLGISSSGGLYMLVSQAAAAEEFFLFKKISVEKTDAVYRAILREKQNIVLSGMPGCGKSTIGKALAENLGKEFVDTDELIVSHENRTIPQIFEENGEKEFRKIEAEIIRRLASKSGAVIALGGGAVLNPQNVQNLKMNGRVFFLNRPIEQIAATDNRPLSSSRAALERRFTERYQIYRETADETVEINSDIQYNIDRLLEII